MFEQLEVVNFTPMMSFLGGLLIGLAALWLLLVQGRIAGVSGICGALLGSGAKGKLAEHGWRAAFVIGLLAAGLASADFAPQSEMEYGLSRSTFVLLLAGLLVGFGTRMSSGCTSGHGVCGLGRLSKRSAAATGTFMGVGVLTAAAITQVLGGAL